MTAQPPAAGQSAPADLTSRLMEARRLFDSLLARYRTGEIDVATLEQGRAPLAVPDGRGGYWTPDVDGRWLYYDGAAWVPAQLSLELTPPSPPAPVAAPAAAQPAQPRPASAQANSQGHGQPTAGRATTPARKRKPRGGRPGCRIALIVGAVLLVALILVALLLLNEVRSLPWEVSVSPGQQISTPADAAADGIPAALLATPAPLPKDDRPPARDPRILLDDAFSADLGRWPAEANERHSAALGAGQYTIQILQPGGAYWRSYGDAESAAYMLVADVIPLDDEPGSQGLVFLQSDAGQYRFAVDGAGRYRLSLFHEDAWREVIPWTAHASIVGAALPNRLGVEIRAGTITLYANGSRLNSVPAPERLNGRPGIFCEAGDGPSGHGVAFDNLIVYAPFEGPVAYSADQMRLILDAGLPQSFALVQFETEQGTRVRHETWSYHHSGMSFLFEDGVFVNWEEAETLPPSAQPNPWHPDQFALGEPPEELFGRYPEHAWHLIGSETLYDMPLRLYAGDDVIIGYYENALVLVHAPAAQGGTP